MCGVPQGSVLGPTLFNCFVTPLGDLIKSMVGVTHVSFADDMQLIVSDVDPASCIARATNYVGIIRSWLVANGLAFNDNKLELLPFHHTPPDNDYALTVGNTTCIPKTHLKDLGITLDTNMSLELWVASTVKICFSVLRNLWPIRRHLSFASAKSLAHAHILSRLDYCNSLLLPSNQQLIKRMQRVQNCAARFVYGLSSRSHSSHLIRCRGFSGSPFYRVAMSHPANQRAGFGRHFLTPASDPRFLMPSHTIFSTSEDDCPQPEKPRQRQFQSLVVKGFHTACNWELGIFQ